MPDAQRPLPKDASQNILTLERWRDGEMGGQLLTASSASLSSHLTDCPPFVSPTRPAAGLIRVGLAKSFSLAHGPTRVSEARQTRHGVCRPHLSRLFDLPAVRRKPARPQRRPRVQRRRGSGINARMRWLTVGCLWLLTACGPAQFQQEKLNDGSIKVTCELAMDECVRSAQELCSNQRFRIIEGTSETRLRDVPPFETAYHTSRLHLMCSNDGAKPLLSLDKAAEERPGSPGPKPMDACSVGQTRECVGPGACKGGQACLPDGKGFGTCDCGPSAPPPPAPAPAAAPVSTPVDAGTSPATGATPQQNPAAK